MNPILAISGSLRRDSYNTALLKAVKEMFPNTVEIGSIREVPLYDGDVESEGMPEAVQQLKLRLADAPGLLLASPEYNSSVPGVLKNVIDWLSRPSNDIRNVFKDKPVAVIGASPGGFGTVLAQNAWLPVFRGLGARNFTGGRLLVSGAGRIFDDQGRLQDDEIRQRLHKFFTDFERFCAG